jgi:hypothetical protein
MPIFYQLPKIDNVPIIDYLDKDFADTEYEINCYVGDRIQINMTPVSNSFFLIPHDFKKIQSNKTYLSMCKEIAIRFGSTLVIPNYGDFAQSADLQNSIELRTNIQPGEKIKGRVIIVPYRVKPLPFEPISIQDPSISFSGYVPNISPRKLVGAMYRNPFHPISGSGLIVRNYGIRKLVKGDFPLHLNKRSSFALLREHSEMKLSTERSEFLESMKSSNFAFCPRGDGNASGRFFEALSAGRIPVVPDTKVRFPLENSIKWDRWIVQVPMFGDWNSILHSFIEKFDDDSYLSFQRDMREFFLQRLQAKSFFFNLFSTGFKC